MTTFSSRGHTDHAAVPGDPLLARDTLISRLRRQVDQLTPVAELVTVRDAEVSTLRARLDATLATRRLEAEALQRRVDELERLLGDALRRAEHAEALEESLARAEAERRDAVAAAGRAAAEASARIAEADAGHPAERSLASARARIASLEAALAARSSGITRGSGYADADALFRRRLDERVAVWKRLFERRIESQGLALEEKERIIAKLTGRLAGSGTHTEPIDPEDLTLVRGIGPEIARTLRSLGYRTLEDLRDLGPEDLSRIDGALTAFHGRAERDRWSEQAREILDRAVDHNHQAPPV